VADEFTFIDLFAGIGGFRLGLSAAGGVPVFSNEWDKHAAQTYRSWYGDSELSTEDIREINIERDIPEHDVLSAGFPCQPFSIAGVSKKISLGRPHGFADLKQGNLFFSICEIVAIRRPKIVLLENVKNLLGHDGGETWEIIKQSLESLNYEIRHEVINAAGWVPQNRRRVFIVAFSREVFDQETIKNFSFPVSDLPPKQLRSILESKSPDKKYMLTDNLWLYLQEYAARHKAKGNGFGYKLYGPSDTAGTLSARYYKDGAEILIRQKGWRNPRRLTPAEAGRLMGFNAEFAVANGFDGAFPQVVSDMQSYKQYGNSVSPLVVKEIALEIAQVLRKSKSENVSRRKKKL
jgi:DNA (cytosine-5)-methyltransferase 1